MEVSRISAELKFIEANGVTLNIEERTRLSLAIQELKANSKLQPPNLLS